MADKEVSVSAEQVLKNRRGELFLRAADLLARECGITKESAVNYYIVLTFREKTQNSGEEAGEHESRTRLLERNTSRMLNDESFRNKALKLAETEGFLIR